jgi:RNA polymerase II subunit A C-terminal domain phosphatase
VGGEKAAPKDRDVDLKLVPDIKIIMPQIKCQVLDGVILVISGVLPLGTDTQNADISLWAKSFGAVIASKNRGKDDTPCGRKKQNCQGAIGNKVSIMIVTTQWLLDSG